MMQVSFRPQITSFKGSFKVNDPNAYLPDEDNNIRKRPARQEEPSNVEQTKIHEPARKSKYKVFQIEDDNGKTTYVDMLESDLTTFYKKVRPEIGRFCEFHGINYNRDLFLASGINKLHQRFIVFNTFFKYADEEYAQMFCLKSEDENYTQAQKDIVRVFNDKLNRHFLIQGNEKNPFMAVCAPGAEANRVFPHALKSLANVSKEIDFDDTLDEKGRTYPVIYTADGKYTRYRMIQLSKPLLADTKSREDVIQNPICQDLPAYLVQSQNRPF